MTQTPPTEKRMKLRYRGECRVCGTEIDAGVAAIYEKSTKTVRCLHHDAVETPAAPEPAPETPTPVATEQLSANPVSPMAATEVTEIGVPGASARREYERRKQAREVRVMSKHPKIGKFLLAVVDDPQTTNAWQTGAHGEEKLGALLNDLAGEGVLALHDRRIPRSRANIDHIAVAPSGVWVIDAKKYRGRPQLKFEGGVLRPRTEKLLVGSRDCTKLVDGVLKQVALVKDAAPDVPVHGVLCFVEADWPLIGGAFTTREVQALWPKRLAKQLRADGDLSPEQVTAVHAELARVFVPA